MSANSVRSTAQHRVNLGPSDLYLCGHLKTLVYSAPIENRHFINAFFYAVRPWTLAPELSKRRDSPRSDVPTRALIRMQNILSTPVNCD